MQSIAPNLIILRIALGNAASSPTEMSTMTFKLSTFLTHRVEGPSQTLDTITANDSFGTSRTSIPVLSIGDGLWGSESKSGAVRSATDKDGFV